MLTLSLTQLIIRRLMSNYQQISKYLTKIKNSQCFSKSVVLKELLAYLVEKSLHGETPKEVEIAYDVFGKSKNSEKEKNIRIYIYNLRKKLKDYYDKEGLEDETVFSIPKGAYELVIKTNLKRTIKSRIGKLSPFLLMISVLILLLSVLLSGNKRSAISKSFIWNDIYKSDYPLLIVLGDHYFINQKNVFGWMSPTRFVEINSDDDFEEMIEKTPDKADKLEKTDQTYINKQAPFAMHKVMNFLAGNNLQINMRYSSDMKWEYVQDYNTLFIGSYKTQNIFKNIFQELGVSFIFDGSKVAYTANDSTTIFDPRDDKFLNKEFASLIHFRTKDNRTVMALMCNTDVGNIGTIKYLSEINNLKKLKKLTSHFNGDNFKALFEVRGEKQTDFELCLKRIDPITANIDELWP